MQAIRPPGWNIERSQSADKLGECRNLPTGQIHDSHDHVLVGRMIARAFFVRQECQLPAVGGWMGKAVFKIIGGQLFLGCAIGFHSPDLRGAGALGIEIDKLAVGRIFRAVFFFRGVGVVGKLRFVAANRGNGVNVKRAIAPPAEYQRFAVGRPAMNVRGFIALGDAG